MKLSPGGRTTKEFSLPHDRYPENDDSDHGGVLMRQLILQMSVTVDGYVAGSGGE